MLKFYCTHPLDVQNLPIGFTILRDVLLISITLQNLGYTSHCFYPPQKRLKFAPVRTRHSDIIFRPLTRRDILRDSIEASRTSIPIFGPLSCVYTCVISLSTSLDYAFVSVGLPCSSPRNSTSFPSLQPARFVYATRRLSINRSAFRLPARDHKSSTVDLIGEFSCIVLISGPGFLVQYR